MIQYCFISGKKTMQTIYGLIKNNGDGGCSIVWLKNREIAEKLLQSEYYFEDFAYNEGEISQTLTFPDLLDLENCNFNFVDQYYNK